MSAKEKIIDRAIVINDFKHNHQNDLNIVDKDDRESRFFRRLKRKYRLALAFLFFLSLLLIFMILPMVIGAIAQGIWR